MTPSEKPEYHDESEPTDNAPIQGVEHHEDSEVKQAQEFALWLEKGYLSFRKRKKEIGFPDNGD